ncbi:MAG: hypothetical protein Q8L36_03100 [bacterium]|nr:hypothetical protein [bacterium]
MAKTSRDAYRHIREWSEFFSGLNDISKTEVDEFVARKRQKKYLQQSLDRLRRRGFIIEKGDDLSLTLTGRNFFRRHKLIVKEKISSKSWDGRWRLVSFDVPGGYRRERDQLREILKMYDFYPLHKSVWVCPEALSEKFWQLIVEKGLHPFCKTMVVEVVEGDEELKKHFKITS